MNPVNNERTAKTINIKDELQNTIKGTVVSFCPRIAVKITSNPMKISENHSIIHSIVIIFLLSSEISPKSLPTDFVGIK